MSGRNRNHAPRRIYSSAERRRALDLADRIGNVAASEELGIGRSTLRNWQMRKRRGDLPKPALQLVTADDCYRAPTPAELRARWDERGSYQPTVLRTGRELLDVIWNDRTGVA